MQRLRTTGSTMVGYLTVPQLKRKYMNSRAAVEDTYYSTKDTFERHKVVFTISTSLASVATAWIGYTLRHLHEKKVEQRLDSIENAMKKNYDIEHSEFRKLVDTSSTAACFATAGTTLILGYGLGWRGGKWYANRKFRREQMKLLGQIKPRRWPLKFLRRPLLRHTVKRPERPEVSPNGASSTHQSGETTPAC